MKSALLWSPSPSPFLPLPPTSNESCFPIEPSVVLCGYHSRYDTRLVVFNERDQAMGALAPNTGAEVTGPITLVPLPRFMYLPKSEAATTRLSLVVESGNRDLPEESSFTELPVVRESDFRSGKLQIIGVRLDHGFRQTVRMYGLDGHAYGKVMMRVYPLDSTDLLHSCEHELWPLTSEVTADGLPLRPSFGMECDMSEHLHGHGDKVRIKLEPLTPGCATGPSSR